MMPYRIDLFAIFIFLGIVQAVFLSVFFFSKENRKVQANIFYGILFLSMAASNLEILLMYTGYIVNVLHLVDFSEPIAFLIGPSFYLMIRALSSGKINKVEYLHYAFALVYFLLVIPFYLLPEDVKYNAWIESYKIDAPFRDYDYSQGDPRVFWITDHHTSLTIASLIFYSVLSLIEVVKVFRQKRESFFAPKLQVLKNFKAGTIQIAIAIILTLIIKALHPNDTGDHIFAAYMAVAIYMTSFRVMRSSGFFKATSLTEAERYKNSLIPADQQQQLLSKLDELMVKDKPFLRSDVSLPELAEKLGTTVHVLSQTINAGLGKSFFEMIASYRVEEAKTLLVKQKNIKVEEIAEQVGYNSKSSFNTAFKKVTGLTPSEFRNTQ
jgi:AraC-like DNA-binding protein